MFWTDSNIILTWIQRFPEQLKTLIGNRIKIIQRLTKNCQWNHVSSNDNPADLISRGLNASDISSKQLWWFIKNCRNPSVKKSGQLDYSEVNEAELWLIRNLQASAFKEENDALAKGGCISQKKKLSAADATVQLRLYTYEISKNHSSKAILFTIYQFGYCVIDGSLTLAAISRRKWNIAFLKSEAEKVFAVCCLITEKVYLANFVLWS
ncbi:integrase catalytic domain-containing protein [Trichonephila clavata]|uniref:Integrase catalytic domain-containing protein n=1 Tax=Trichonephila clavata TaxID=2740835 RepID=A0A8X6LNA5_TRICU|nr:integrase catalytic domain-containing protein [Trichonephila clavata]